MLGLYEVFVFTRRPLWFMIFGGVFDRHPDLKVVVSENGVQWLPSLIRDMESFFDTHGGAPVRSYLEMRPRDYFEKHVWMGGSLMKRYEAEMRHEIGIDKLMWGADYPHLEGAAPVHRETLRYIFGGLPEDDLRRMLGANAVDLWGFDGDLLQSVADRVGPTVADLAEPLALADIEDTFSWSLARPVPLGGARGLNHMCSHAGCGLAWRWRRVSWSGSVWHHDSLHGVHCTTTHGTHSCHDCAARRGTVRDNARRMSTPPCRHNKLPRSRFDGLKHGPPEERSPRRTRNVEGNFGPQVCDNRVLPSKPWSWRTSPRHSMHWWPLGAANYGDGASIDELHRLLLALRVLRHRGHRGLRGGGGVGGRRGQDGGGLDREHVAGSRVAVAKRRVRLARTLRQLPACAQAWRDGAIGVEQARAIASARRHRTESSMARDEAMLVAQAAAMGFEDFSRALSYWKQLADPDGAEASDEERKASRNVFLESSFTGMWLGQMTLDPIAGSIVAGELNRLEHDLFEADCAEAKERLGRTARIDELARTSAQRRADALVEMATRSRTAPAEGIRPAPLFSVFVGYETMHGPHLRARERHRARPLGPDAVDGLGLLRAGHLLAGQPDRRQRAGPALHRWDPPGHRAAGPHLHPPALLRARRELPGRPHSDLRRRAARPPRRTAGLLCGFHNRLRNQQERRGEQRQRPPPSAA